MSGTNISPNNDEWMLILIDRWLVCRWQGLARLIKKPHHYHYWPFVNVNTMVIGKLWIILDEESRKKKEIGIHELKSPSNITVPNASLLKVRLLKDAHDFKKYHRKISHAKDRGRWLTCSLRINLGPAKIQQMHCTTKSCVHWRYDCKIIFKWSHCTQRKDSG